MEQTVLALNRSSSSALLQLQTVSYCPSGGGGRSRGPACGLVQPGAEVGSLPHTPDSGSPDQERAEPHFPAAADDDLYPRTYSLVRIFIRRHVDSQSQELEERGRGGGWLSGCGGWARGGEGGGERRAADTLEQVGARLISKHGTAFTGMISRLNISGRSDLEAIPRVATEMFSDGEVNWGRVVSFIAFGAVMGVHLKKIQREDCIDEVAVQVTQYLVQQKRDWLETHGGWDGFTKFFHENNAEDSAKKALMWIAGFGIAGAGIMHLLR